jgi:DNA-binding IclR family transcriptional regulator
MNIERRLDPLALRVLRALFDLAQHDRPVHAGAIAEVLGMGRSLAAAALLRLDAAGYVRAEEARLTMAGLVLASRLCPVALRAPGLRPSETRSGQAAARGMHKARRARAPLTLPSGFRRATFA